MKLFGQKSGSIVAQYSRQFEKVFLDILRRRHGTLKISANRVYQEVIQDKEHVHMNATRWSTLSGFVQYLGKTGKCIVEESERGWNIQYIERDPFLLERKETARKRAEAERLEELKQAKRMELQRIEAAKALDRAGGVVSTEASNMDTNKNKSVAISFSSKTKKTEKTVTSKSILGNDDSDQEEPQKETVKRTLTLENPDVEDVSLKQQPKKFKISNDQIRANWLRTGIIVKILSKSLCNGEYYKRKCIIDKVIDKFTAQVKVLDSSPNTQDGGDVIQLDQDDLQTVIPSKIGKKVKIVNGKWRGCWATVLQLNDKMWVADLELLADERNLIKNISYDYFSKAE